LDDPETSFAGKQSELIGRWLKPRIAQPT